MKTKKPLGLTDYSTAVFGLLILAMAFGAFCCAVYGFIKYVI